MPDPQPTKLLGVRADVVLALAVAVVAAVVYWPITGHAFIDYDDNVYVTENLPVQGGLTLEGIGWALTSGHASNWHPLTWISHMIDVELYGLDAGGHHASALLLHAANSALVLFVLHVYTRRLWPSAIVAALFASHPLHVESVAWVAERKDLLSTFFWLLTMLAYVAWTRRPSAGRYATTTVLLALGLMAKPMVVTLPFVLVLMDAWPLRRLDLNVGALRARVVEKLPWFGLAIASSVVTFIVQRAGGAVESLEVIPLGSRMMNAVHAYAGYVGLTIWPHDLAVLYPHPPGGLSVTKFLVALVAVLGLSALAWRTWKLERAVTIGWLWFLGTLVPVIGIVQVGSQSMADRYTYVPHIGLFTMVVFGAATLWQRHARVLAGVAVAAILVFAVLTRAQVRRWENSHTLFEHTLAVTERNPTIEYNFGTTLANEGDHEKAREHLEATVRMQPRHLKALINLGHVVKLLGDADGAEPYYRRALEVNPRSVGANWGYAQIFIERRDAKSAVEHLEIVVAEDPEHVQGRMNLGAMYAALRRYDEAREQIDAALELDPTQEDKAKQMLARFPKRGG